MSDILQMSTEEVRRVQVLELLIHGDIHQGQAAERLGLSVRQVKRLKRAYKRRGAKALVSKKRGRPSHHPLERQGKAQAIQLLKSR